MDLPKAWRTVTTIVAFNASYLIADVEHDTVFEFAVSRARFALLLSVSSAR